MLNIFLKKKIANAFDTWADSYAADVTPKLDRRGYGYAKLAEFIIAKINPEPRATMIEIGTGTGVLGEKVYAVRPDITLLGCDISRAMLSKAKLGSAYQILLHCDAECYLPFHDTGFRYIYSAFMAHSAINMKRFLSECRRILTKDSTLVMVDLFRTKKRVPVFSKLLDNFHSIRYEYGAFSNYYLVDEFITLAESVGFHLEEPIQLDAGEHIVNAAAGNMGHFLLTMRLNRE